MNGVKVKGHVKGFDSYIILLEGENKQQNLIYKHAVSTIVPGKNMNLQNANQNNTLIYSRLSQFKILYKKS